MDRLDLVFNVVILVGCILFTSGIVLSVIYLNSSNNRDLKPTRILIFHGLGFIIVGLVLLIIKFLLVGTGG